MTSVVIEGLGLCAVLFLYCAIGIRKGAVNLVYLYEEDVQKRVVERGLITAEKLKENKTVFLLIGLLMYLAYPLICVYAINGARGFLEGFWQLCVIILMMGVFDRIVIDVIWVGHTKAWFIPGTEDLMPYIPIKVHIRKWVLTLVMFPALIALISWIMSLVIR